MKMSKQYQISLKKNNFWIFCYIKKIDLFKFNIINNNQTLNMSTIRFTVDGKKKAFKLRKTKKKTRRTYTYWKIYPFKIT